VTIAAVNSGYPPLYHAQGGRHLRVRVGDGLAASNNTGLIGSEDELWGNCPVLSYLLDPTLAVLYDEPFTGYDATNDWTLTQATTGSAAISTTVPGALKLDAGDTTAHHGANLQRLVAGFIPAANKSLWFEVGVVLGTALTGELFLGLSGSNTAIISAGSLVTAAKNLIGFSSVTGDGVMLFQSDKAGTAYTPDASPVTLSLTATNYLGFFYDGVADTVQAYVNGVAVGGAVPTANVPKVVMYPSFVCQNQGTDRPTMTVSALRVFQLR
jgi:hypothetical protein